MITTTLENTRKPDVTFYKGGRIDICSRTARQLNLSEGDVIDIATDKGEYMLFVRHRAENTIGRHEAQVYAAKRCKIFTHCFRTHSRKLTNAIFRASRESEEKEVLRIPAGVPMEVEGIGTAVPLITRNPL